MKVGIVSLFGTINYGNRLQSYASQEIFRRLGMETEVVYVRPFKTSLRELGKTVYFSHLFQRFHHSSKAAILKYKRQKSFEAFNKQYIHLKKYHSVASISGADFYALGSDQVWNPKRYDAIRKELFFLTFAPPRKKICLSPSFGVEDIPEGWKDYYRKHLSTFPRLSVRETSGARIIEDLTGKSVPVLIDPTLVFDKPFWKCVESRPKGLDTDSNYVLDYFLGPPTAAAAANGEAWAKRIGAKRYDLFDTARPELYTAGPSEFLYLLDHASLIQTDSFHACVFAFLFGKPFLVYAREGRDADMFSRMETLFSAFGLARKFVGSGLDNDVMECDYNAGYARLEQERERFWSFLRVSMEI